MSHKHRDRIMTDPEPPKPDPEDPDDVEPLDEAEDLLTVLALLAQRLHINAVAPDTASIAGIQAFAAEHGVDITMDTIIKALKQAQVVLLQRQLQGV
jgi:hypothetical protein